MNDHDEDCDCDECVAPSTLADLPMYIRLSPQTYEEYEALRGRLDTSEAIADEAKKLLYEAEARAELAEHNVTLEEKRYDRAIGDYNEFLAAKKGTNE